MTYEEKVINKLLSKTQRSYDEDKCWIWKGLINNNGYGRISFNGKTVSTHRLSFSLFRENPKELYVLHKCDNTFCVNPEHLFLGTAKDNTQDMCNKGRRGGRKTLTKKQVEEIRDRYFLGLGTHRSLAKEYKVVRSTIWKILTKEHWTEAK